jgi:hypothetical protein
MSISLKWFKEAIKNSIEKVVEKNVTKAFQELENEEKENDLDKPCENGKPYLNIKLVNDVLTIVLNDGNIITKPNANEKDFQDARNSSCESQLFNIIASEEVKAERLIREKEILKAKAIRKGIELLNQFSDFTVVENCVYLKGIHRTLPQLLIEKFLEIISKYEEYSIQQTESLLEKNEEYQSLRRFFMWCCLNPRAEVANELYRFLTDNSFRITKQGFFVALRNVVTLHGSPELVHFISNAYNKVKAVWKKNPDQYTVFLENGEYKLINNDNLTIIKKYTSTVCENCNGEGKLWDDYNEEEDVCSTCNGTGEVEEYEYEQTVSVDHGQKIGGLTELYLDLPNREENRFTDDWTKTFDIRIGQVTSMPMTDCNWSTQDCAAAGLHFTSDQIHYVGCGDQSVLVLINPMKVVGIGTAKGRCYEYLPFMTVPREEATTILHDVDFDTLCIDEKYAIDELDDLINKVKEGFTSETKKHSFNLPNISIEEINNIILSLDDMKKEILNRVSVL